MILGLFTRVRRSLFERQAKPSRKALPQMLEPVTVAQPAERSF